jgi:hyaluronan synthase
MAAPVAIYRGRVAWISLATVPIAGFTVWSVIHVVSVIHALGGHGNTLTFAWAFSFLLLWWVPLSWFERPARTSSRQQRQLNEMTMVVQVPVYNEDPVALRACLESVFDQTRQPDRIRVVDDGSADPLPVIRDWYLDECARFGIDGTWTQQHNQGKRHAQMNVLRHDDSDIIVTLDSDSILDRQALAEGLKPFADPRVTSVAGLVAVLNTKTNWLTFLTAMLYTPFTRGFRSAQSVLKRVTVNSGTLAFYRGEVIRRYAGVYENETFRKRPMQMNDDSMFTFYGLLHGDAVHQPTSVAYTLVPENIDNYRRQQMRWMRGTFVRTFWWFRYAKLTSPVFWMPLLELVQLLMSVAIPVALLFQAQMRDHLGTILLSTLLVDIGVTWMISLRFLMLGRSDESLWFHILLVFTAPIAGLWRLLVVKPMYLYCLVTFWKVGSWGTRAKVEVGL